MLFIVCLAMFCDAVVVGFLTWFCSHIRLAVAVAMLAIAAIEFCLTTVSLFCSLRASGGMSRKRSSLVWLHGFLCVSLFEICIPSTLSAVFVITLLIYRIGGHSIILCSILSSSSIRVLHSLV